MVADEGDARPAASRSRRNASRPMTGASRSSWTRKLRPPGMRERRSATVSRLVVGQPKRSGRPGPVWKWPSKAASLAGWCGATICALEVAGDELREAEDGGEDQRAA